MLAARAAALVSSHKMDPLSRAGRRVLAAAVLLVVRAGCGVAWVDLAFFLPLDDPGLDAPLGRME